MSQLPPELRLDDEEELRFTKFHGSEDTLQNRVNVLKKREENRKRAQENLSKSKKAHDKDESDGEPEHHQEADPENYQDPKDLVEILDGWELFRKKKSNTNTMVKRYCYALD